MNEQVGEALPRRGYRLSDIDYAVTRRRRRAALFRRLLSRHYRHLRSALMPIYAATPHRCFTLRHDRRQRRCRHARGYLRQRHARARARA